MRLVLTLLLLASLHQSAPATQTIPLSIEELIQRADIIAQGTVTSKRTKRLGKSSIYTCIEVKITDTWKGTLTTNVLTVAQAGGILGETIQVIPGQSQFSIGEEVVIFGVWNQRQEAVILGLSQGKFSVTTSANNQTKHCFNPFHGRPASSSSNSAPQAFWKPPLTISRLKTQVTAPKK